MLTDCHPTSLVSDLLRHITTGLLMPRVFVQQWSDRQTWRLQIPD